MHSKRFMRIQTYSPSQRKYTNNSNLDCFILSVESMANNYYSPVYSNTPMIFSKDLYNRCYATGRGAYCRIISSTYSNRLFALFFLNLFCRRFLLKLVHFLQELVHRLFDFVCRFLLSFLYDRQLHFCIHRCPLTIK